MRKEQLNLCPKYLIYLYMGAGNFADECYANLLSVKLPTVPYEALLSSTGESSARQQSNTKLDQFHKAEVRVSGIVNLLPIATDRHLRLGRHSCRTYDKLPTINLAFLASNVLLLNQLYTYYKLGSIAQLIYYQ